LAPPIAYALVSTYQLQQRAAAQAAVGALFFDVLLRRGGTVDQLNQTSISVLHASSTATSVTASWVTNKGGTVLMFAGEPVQWPELRAQEQIRSAGFEGYFNVAVSSREIFVSTFFVSAGFLLLGLAAYVCFRQLPLAALDNALRDVRAKQSQLERQNQRFEAALENMTQGLCLFDDKQRVVVANRRYAEIYDLTPERIKPGTALRQILEARSAKGSYNNGDAETFVRNAIAPFGQDVSQVFERVDGRVISVVRRRIADGGLISTHEDMTEREQLNARLQQQKEQLDAALKNMAYGLCIFDGAQRLVIANDLYAKIYGLTPEQVKPETPLQQVIKQCFANGFNPEEDPEEFLCERLAQTHLTSKKTYKFSDGRSVTISRKPMPGGGWLATHEDITERLRMELALQQSNRQLENQNELLQQQKKELCARNLRLDTALENISQGLCMFDGEQKLVVCNDRYRQIYGLPPELVTPGTTLRQILDRRVANGVHGEDHGRHVQAVVAGHGLLNRIVELSDGRVIGIKHQLMPEGAWIATHEDVTERQKLSARLEEQNVKLDAALTNMSQGLAMFDAEQRVVIANDRVAEMYGQTPEQMKPGTPLREIIEHRIANGLYFGTTVDEVLNRMRERVARMKVSHMTSRMGDGRTITVSIQPRSDGSWVSTHQDITEREKLRDHLDAALNNMVQGLAMFDAEQRLVVCNKRYVEMYDLTAAQVEPGTTARQILEYCVANGCYVGRNPDEMLGSALKLLGPTGTGYYTTKLGDGQAYAVSVTPMADGGTVTTHEDITERRRIEARIAHLAHHDALTDLANRVVLRERLEQALIGTRRQEGVAVLFLDLDRFKEVNDTLGHPVGDELLKAVAGRLRGCVRGSDTLARLGGDEFAIVQIGAAQPTDATALATRIIELMSEPYDLNGHQLMTGASIGIAIAPNDGTDPDQLLKNADLALYRAKSEGRSTYRFFEPAMDARMQARRALETDLHKALANGEFELYYQPIVNLDRDEVSGLEALLRWNHPKRGKVAPAEFVPLAEETGLIVPIGEWVLRQACADAASWPGHIRVAVNLSVVQFKSRNLVEVVFSALAASGVAAERLELEITESVLIEDEQGAFATLRQLRDFGVRIAMDDFGTGYSSLSYLRKFPFNKIKIDGCFVGDLSEDDEEAIAVVRAVAWLGDCLGMVTTAEGVETEEQLKIVRDQGCTEMQGYYFSPPIAAVDVERLFLAQQPQRSADAR
jgi:diguanylate cyclase (GGDEF)-like protein/PAS domain S-box-containing protein